MHMNTQNVCGTSFSSEGPIDQIDASALRKIFGLPEMVNAIGKEDPSIFRTPHITGAQQSATGAE
jgi:hypothetical protein